MFFLYPMIPTDYNLPPTLYRIMNSLANFDAEEKTKIPGLAEKTHSQIFDFTYPLSTNINKDEFEILILNKFMMRRIGYETVTAWKLALQVKLNEIMPIYNKMFDMLEGWDLFKDGEVEVRVKEEEGSNSIDTTSSTSGSVDSRSNDAPQNRIQDVQSGEYVSFYSYDQNRTSVTSGSDGEDSRTTNETITRSPSDKIKIYKEFLDTQESIYSMIYKQLDPLFYGLV